MWIIGVLVLSACSRTNQEYWKEMPEVEPTSVLVEEQIFNSLYLYADRKMILNPTQTLYYFPERIKVGDDLYINSKTGYFLLTTRGTGWSTTYTREWQTKEQLELIFRED